jgi:uncharacterized protein YecE (DUF72 family)
VAPRGVASKGVASKGTAAKGMASRAEAAQGVAARDRDQVAAAPDLVATGALVASDGWPASAVRIGISGWNYAGWRKAFYPKGLQQRRELEFASRRLNSIEINGSFYSLQLVQSWQRWYAETPPGFVFSVKGPRFVTHMKKLRDVEAPVANFFASGLLALADKLGPVLWQLPPNLGFSAERLEEFFALLPRTTVEAAELAARHDSRMDDRALTTTAVNLPLRHALEIRHASFADPAFVELLRRHDVALVWADTGDRFPELADVTSDFAYLRLHGAEELYTSGYDEDSLRRWADRVRLLREGGTPDDAPRVAGPAPHLRRDVYVYFDNDVKVRAPVDAMRLAELTG